MNSTIPTAVVQLAKPLTVAFDFARLIAIEKAVGKSANELAFSDFPQLNAPSKGDDGRDLTPEEKNMERLKRMNMTLVVPFVAGCIGVPTQDLAAVVPAARLRDAFFALVQPFLDAVMQINGIDPDAVKAEVKAEETTDAAAEKDAAEENPPIENIPASPT